MESPMTVLISGYDSPEGPSTATAISTSSTGESSSIVKLTPDGVAGEFYNTGGIPAGLAFHRDGSLYVADEGEEGSTVRWRIADGEATVVVNLDQGKPLNGANDLVFDLMGALLLFRPWGSSGENPIGGFYRYFLDGSLEQIDRDLAFPNGVAVAPDGSAVFLAETYRSRILRYPYC